MQQNDTVKYVENGKAFNALVLSSKTAPDLHPGQIVKKDTPLVEQLSVAFLLTTAQLQQSGTLVSVVPGTFLRVVHGVRPLRGELTTGWLPIDNVQHDPSFTGVPVTDEQVYEALKVQVSLRNPPHFAPIGGATQTQFVDAMNRIVAEEEAKHTSSEVEDSVKIGPDAEVPVDSNLPSAEEVDAQVSGEAPEKTTTLEPNHFIPKPTAEPEQAKADICGHQGSDHPEGGPYLSGTGPNLSAQEVHDTGELTAEVHDGKP